MKLYTTKVAPNPKRVHIFLAEKGIGELRARGGDDVARAGRDRSEAAVEPDGRLGQAGGYGVPVSVYARFPKSSIDQGDSSL